MKIKRIAVDNFRLLSGISIDIEDDITLVVGKNNTGKTSLFEAINIFTDNKNKISFHDFSHNTYNIFRECSQRYEEELFGEHDDQKRDELEKQLVNDIPRITLEIEIEYDIDKDSLVNLSDFISDLDETKHEALIVFRYEPKETINMLEAFRQRKDKQLGLIHWLDTNVEAFYTINCFGGGNRIDENVQGKVASILGFETIQASRKLDDTKTDKNRTLAVGFSDYYRNIHSDQEDVGVLRATLDEISKMLDPKYEKVLEKVLKKLKGFGVDRKINIPDILLKSEFDPESIIKNNIKYFYKSEEINLPENYNGLGYSNLIFLVLKIVAFIENFKKAMETRQTELLTILIEEPEAHLHPQMQQVFVEQIRETIKDAKKNEGVDVQLIISTHSSHMIAEAGINVKRSFERIRYFCRYKKNGGDVLEVKDFNSFKHKENDEATFRFLKQYLNLQRCDLFFADKVIMVEGVTEKLLMPLFIKKVASSLENEYVSIIEVGGAYAHKFKEFFNFLNIKVLVVTDIDSVDEASGKKSCHVLRKDAVTSNPALSGWLPGKSLISELLTLDEGLKVHECRVVRVAYQVAENGESFVARSLENAIINCNQNFFKSSYKYKDRSGNIVDRPVHEDFSYQKLKKLEDIIYLDTDRNQGEIDLSSQQKTAFSFDLMTFDEIGAERTWNVPRYIADGLVWLAKNDHLIFED